MLDRLRVFPDPRSADDHGLLAIGGSYEPQLLLEAYANGIFPWPSSELPYAWFSPHPRFALAPKDLHVSRSLRKLIARQYFSTTFDTAFDDVIEACSKVPRRGQSGTWISTELVDGFRSLHTLGYSHSVETWRGNELVGGLYGIGLGRMFCGESMFHLENDASKVAFVALVERLREWDYALVDCQVETEHLASLGASAMPRDSFLDVVESCRSESSRRGSWAMKDAR